MNLIPIWDQERCDQLVTKYRAKVADMHEELVDPNNLLSEKHNAFLSKEIQGLLTPDAQAFLYELDKSSSVMGGFTMMFVRLCFMQGWLMALEEIDNLAEKNRRPPIE